jgi:hypothetical protein
MTWLLDVPYDPARAIEGRADAFQIRKPLLDYRHSKFIRQTFSEPRKTCYVRL